MLRDDLQKVSEIWIKEGLALSRPICPIELNKVFEGLGKRVSRDVIEVYSNLGGMEDWGTDSTFFSFWTIERILEENQIFQTDSDLIFFADFLINSHLYGFKFEDENPSSIHIYHGEKDIEKVADSFNEFFEIYLNEPRNLLLFDRE